MVIFCQGQIRDAAEILTIRGEEKTKKETVEYSKLVFSKKSHFRQK